MNRVSSRLAAHAGIRQTEAVIRADRAADLASAAVLRTWRQVLALLGSGASPWEAQQEAAAIFGRLSHEVVNDLGDYLHRTARWGYKTAAANLTREVPQQLLTYAARQEAVSESANRSEPSGGVVLRLRETVAGPMHLSRSVLLSEAVPAVADILFPGFSVDEVAQVVYSSGWVERLTFATALSSSPATLASILAGGLTAGKLPREIAKDLLPVVQGVQSTARRIARTESMRVSNAAQMACHRQLGDLIIGYQVLPVLDQHSRPWHAARKGTIYYLRPKPGQKGPRQMPHPPHEPDDPAETPARVQRYASWREAWNCRCVLVPVLSDPGAPAGLIVPASTPDPLVYRDWWAQADERRRRLAVGRRRYEVVSDLLRRPPAWEELLDPADMDVMTTAALRVETPTQRAERVAKVRAELAHRADLARQVSQQGFVSEPTLPVVVKPKPKPRPKPPKKRPYKVHEEGSEEFRKQAHAALDSIPHAAHKTVAKHGGTVAMVETVTKALPHLVGVTPSGWPAGTTWDNADGAYDSATKKVIVAERIVHVGEAFAWKSDRVPGVLRHEFGHGLDHALGQHGVDFTTLNKEFNDAYNADHLAITNTKGLEYYLQPFPRGGQEAFAEVFAQMHGSGSSPDDILKHFPRVQAVIKKKLEGL